ncbi:MULTISPECIES: response regulator [unclassified Leisingera]|uniref:response regulator n=1 Tax=unclassified Leisingera TaxID=2614906 RepID=UPI0002D74C49|nr:MULTISPECIES: response regulator [unclassified Leisingera]KIC16118.1 lipoprotein [Leisingera sp. ANG-DT]KIC25983.1 lipoprotein [Leisingera sp. ANG-S3]KIC30293.1 lipoprotein [Leisingera sp. ANG-M6]KIC33192.1 lipoprotein [Leisingera sp. ANG-S5]KIC53289.1 lipoprotein [Leisingera sp. ANG-S]
MQLNPPEQMQPVNILLVEDDDFEAMAVRRAFAKARLSNQITRAHDGEEALEILEQRHPEVSVNGPVIMLIDINMPRMNGHELVEAIRSRQALRHMICFMLTTSREPRDVDRAYQQNVAGYIIKETAGHDFSNLLNLLGDYWITVQLPTPH